MKYRQIVAGRFVERPNRFIAKVEIDGQIETVHVKNTGRCRELLQDGTVVYLEKSDNPNRSTRYDLVAVEKGSRMVNMDSQAPNKVVEEWLREQGLFADTILVRPETKYGNSRFDFYIETEKEKIFMEVKGVTLEEDGVVRFPDAPSERAVKHLQELIEAKRAGYRAFVLFVIQMEGVRYFAPNEDTHPAFAESLRRAVNAGVEVLAYDCKVTAEGMLLHAPVEVHLKKTFSSNPLEAICNPLLKWYDSNRRVLPWREEPTPYHVWVSEIMLQQTRVEAVKPYYERFMKALPDIEALAKVEEEELLKLWEGLGYYNRARNLQKAAIQIMQDYGGVMPQDYDKLLKLCGIGSYTAGAVSSIAFGKPMPAVDGNVLRVLSRIREDAREITDAKVKSAVEQELAEVMPKDRPGDFNQAMMELGACVCIPNGAPLCGKCPLRELCGAHIAKAELSYPKKQPKKARVVEEKTILVVQDAAKVALRKRSEKGLLAGMYELPSMQGFCSAEEVVAYLEDNGLKIIRIRPLEDAKHIFTHREWAMKGFYVRVDELEHKEPKAALEDWLYVDIHKMEEKYPIPSAFAAYKKLLGVKSNLQK